MATPLHDNNIVPFEKPSASVVCVTPEIAERWLERNTSNRRVRPLHVTKLARDMADGDWQLTGEAIKFNHAGMVLDGQHRLHAVVRSGATVQMFVVRGLDDDTQKVMDAGAARTAGDNLILTGFKNAHLLAAAVRLLLRHQLGGAAWNYDPSHSEIYLFIEQNPDIEVAANIAQTYVKFLDIRPAVIAATTYMIGNAAGYDRANEFWDAAAHKVGLRKGDPVLAMTNAFSQARVNRRNIDVRAQISAILRMYNARRTGAPVRIVKFVSPGGSADHVAIPKVVMA